MSAERDMKEGQLVRLNRKISELEMLVDGDASALRVLTMPSGSSLDIDGESVLVHAKEIQRRLAEANKLRAQREKLRDDLGYND